MRSMPGDTVVSEAVANHFQRVAFHLAALRREFGSRSIDYSETADCWVDSAAWLLSKGGRLFADSDLSFSGKMNGKGHTYALVWCPDPVLEVSLEEPGGLYARVCGRHNRRPWPVSQGLDRCPEGRFDSPTDVCTLRRIPVPGLWKREG